MVATANNAHTWCMCVVTVGQFPCSGAICPLEAYVKRRCGEYSESCWLQALVDSVQEGVQRARRESYAFIVDSPMAAYVSGRPPCDLYVTEPFLTQMTYAFAVRRGSTALIPF